MSKRFHAVKLLVAFVVCVLASPDANRAEAQSRKKVEVPVEITKQLLQEDWIKELLQRKLQYNLAGLSKYLVAESLDLNGDGKPEILIHGIGDICGANNCANWIYRKTGKGYELILDADAINNVEVRNTRTNGYRDVMTAMHGSASDSDLTLYKFDGQRYRRKGCFERHYSNSEDKSGHLHTKRTPQIKRVKCEAEQ